MPGYCPNCETLMSLNDINCLKCSEDFAVEIAQAESMSYTPDDYFEDNFGL